MIARESTKGGRISTFVLEPEHSVRTSFLVSWRHAYDFENLRNDFFDAFGV